MAVGSWPKGYIEDAYPWMWEGYGQVKGKIDVIFDVKNDLEGVYDQATTGIAMGQLQQMSSYDAAPTIRRPSEGFTSYCQLLEFKDEFQLGKVEVERFPKNKVRNLAKDAITSWGYKLKTTEETHAAKLFTRGGYTAGDDSFNAVIPGLGSFVTNGLAYDAKPFFNRSDNTRTSKGGGTYYNAINSDLNVANFATLHDLVFSTNAKDERDELIDTSTAGRKILLTPTVLRDEAFSVLKDPILAGATNDQGNPWKGLADHEDWRFLDGNVNTWYLGIAKKGICFYRGGKPEIAPYRDPHTGAYGATIAALIGFMGKNWRYWGASKSPLS